MNIYEEIVEAIKNNKPYAVATIVKTIGCAPRSAGTKMIVYGDGSFSGTIGGSAVELLAIEDCKKAIISGQPALKLYSPETTCQDGCEKILEVFIEPGDLRPRLYLLGAGHVAQAVLPYACRLGFHTVVIDPRDVSSYKKLYEAADEMIHVKGFSDIKELDIVPNSFIIVCTYSHDTDGEAIEAIMDKNPAYIGMLGAKHKFVPIFKRLHDLGYSDEVLRNIHAPIGLDLGGETPDELGISIMAEIMKIRYDRTGMHLRDKKKIFDSIQF